MQSKEVPVAGFPQITITTPPIVNAAQFLHPNSHFLKTFTIDAGDLTEI